MVPKFKDFSHPFFEKTPKGDIAELSTDDLSTAFNHLVRMFQNGIDDLNLLSLAEKNHQSKNFSNYAFKKVAHYFPNLERVKISKGSAEHYSNGPVMKNLKIVELAGSSSRSHHIFCSSFLFMDLCPALQSAHIKIDCGPILTHYSVKNANLQDLVIQFFRPRKWKELPMFMSKYPNLKHLSLRNEYLSDEDIKQLISILPKLTLLDVRKSIGVTEEAANHVQDYCKQHGRSIKFYFKKDDKQIESDWPQALNRREKICRGFDFMEHCFFKSFNDFYYSKVTLTMLINELPDDCFLEIFDYIQDLKDLINCFKVCEKWSNLIVVRTKKVKYFIDQPNYSPDSVCHQTDEPIDVTFLSKWLPNLRIVDLLYTRNGETPIEDIIKIIRELESLKGIIYGCHYCMESCLDFESIPENPNLEMLSTGYIDLNIKEINENMKQLYLWDSTLDVFAEVAHHFPNLERLMSKYPNLKNLALRGTSLKDAQIKQLILILPKLTLLDIRESSGVTQEAADHVRDYCKQYDRSIKFYFKADDKQIESDWPQLLNGPDKICRGFDFMEHCFFKSFNQLPHFLHPLDD
uniref:F-box domain-containing protein n=1 Tax=Tetranychus urticae TaxID=32264 RepID=T1K4C5_TETUR